jgi:hypothetical protein
MAKSRINAKIIKAGAFFVMYSIIFPWINLSIFVVFMSIRYDTSVNVNSDIMLIGKILEYDICWFGLRARK